MRTSAITFITAEDGDDQVVSLAVGKYTETGFTLTRTPEYQSPLPGEERGVSVCMGETGNLEPEMLLSLEWE